MEARQAIDQAKAALIASRDLNSILNRTGVVHVPLAREVPRPTSDGAHPDDPVFFVTFTIEKTVLGRRLMAEFQGHKEFAA